MIFVGLSTKKYLGTFSRSFLFKVYKFSIGVVMFAFLIPRLRMNSLRACGFIPLSLRDWSDQVRGSLYPVYSPDFTFFAPFDFDIFTPFISNWPL